MPRTLLLVLLSCALLSANAQTYYFPKTIYADSVQLQAQLPALAAKLVASMEAKGHIANLRNAARLHLLAGNDARFKYWLDSFVMVNVGLPLENTDINLETRLFATVRKTAQPGSKVFEEQYRAKLQNYFAAMPLYSQQNAQFLAERSVKEFEDRYQQQLSKCKQQDSLSQEAATVFCLAYINREVYGKTLPLIKEFLQQRNELRYLVKDSILISTPDGAKLSITVVRPKQVKGPLPVVLVNNIYAGFDVSLAKIAVDYGYVGVVANPRGKRLSPDSLHPFEFDAQDGYTVIDWISKQSWCNGKVGMYGGSYLGFTQWAATKKMHPALKTIVPAVSVAAGWDFPMANGVYIGYMLQWIHYVNNNKNTDMADFGDNEKWLKLYDKWYQLGLPFNKLDSLEGRPEPLFQRWLQHPTYDAYWKNMTPQGPEFAKIKIPVFTLTGYFDDDQLGALYYWKQLHAWNKNPYAYLLIGPWNHNGAQGFPKMEHLGYKTDPVSVIKIEPIIFEWFNHVLKGAPRPKILKDKVNFQIMGANQWGSAPSLETMYTDSLVFYPGKPLENGRYALSKQSNTNIIHQSLNLAYRGETLHQGEDGEGSGLIVDSSLYADSNKLVFVSEPLTKAMTISGAVTAQLLTRINKKDMDLIMEIYDQMPNGQYQYLGRSLQRASYAFGPTQRKLLHPGQWEWIPLNNTYQSTKKLLPGSRIVIRLGINKSPLWQINYGTGRDVSTESILDAREPLEIDWSGESRFVVRVLR